MTTSALTSTTAATTAPGTCWECGGPCLHYTGTEHGWRCRSCLARYLDKSAAAFTAFTAAERDRLIEVTKPKRDRRGGPGTGYGPRDHHDDPDDADHQDVMR